MYGLSDVEEIKRTDIPCDAWDGCDKPATHCIELEFEYGGRFRRCVCDEHAQEIFDRCRRDREEQEEGERKEMGFCPECGYRKTSHAEDCFERPLTSFEVHK